MNGNLQPSRRVLSVRRFGLLATTIAGLGAAAFFVAPNMSPNGTFFAALSLRTRNRELLLPLVLCPIAMPALLAMIQATTNVLTADYPPSLWIKLLIGYDVVFTTACILLFETVLNAGD